MPGEQLIHGRIGKDLDFCFAASRCAGQKCAGCAGMNRHPVGVDARHGQHLIPERRERLEDWGQREVAAFRLIANVTGAGGDVSRLPQRRIDRARGP